MVDNLEKKDVYLNNQSKGIPKRIIDSSQIEASLTEGLTSDQIAESQK